MSARQRGEIKKRADVGDLLTEKRRSVLASHGFRVNGFCEKNVMKNCKNCEIGKMSCIMRDSMEHLDKHRFLNYDVGR